MKNLIGEYYVVVKDHRYKIHPTENIILRERDEPKSLRTQNQVQNETQIRRNQKVVKNDNNQLVVKNYPENKQPIIQQQNFKPPNCPTCKQNFWIDFDEGFYCKNCEYIINKQKHQIDKKILRQERGFSTRLNYANKKIKEIWMNMVNTTYNSTEDMIDKLQQLKGKIKLNFLKNLNIYYDNMNIRFDETPFAKNVQSFSKFYHEVLKLMKVLQTKPQVKNMNNVYYDLFYTIIKNGDEKEIVDNQYENDYFDFNNFITPNHTISIKPRETILK